MDLGSSKGSEVWFYGDRIPVVDRNGFLLLCPISLRSPAAGGFSSSGLFVIAAAGNGGGGHGEKTFGPANGDSVGERDDWRIGVVFYPYRWGHDYCGSQSGGE